MVMPKTFKTPEELQKVVNEYFAYCEDCNYDEHGKIAITKPLLITGLCDFIGIHKDTWYEYAKQPGFNEICKNAKQKIESFTVGMATINKTNPIITIFNLKNNFGYTDKVDVTTHNEPERLSMEDIRQKLSEKKDDGNSNE